jgi:hypothetical protein
MKVYGEVEYNSTHSYPWWMASFPPRSIYPRKTVLLPVNKESGWVPKLAWMLWRKEKSLAPTGHWNTVLHLFKYHAYVENPHWSGNIKVKRKYTILLSSSPVTPIALQTVSVPCSTSLSSPLIVLNCGLTDFCLYCKCMWTKRMSPNITTVK